MIDLHRSRSTYFFLAKIKNREKQKFFNCCKVGTESVITQNLEVMLLGLHVINFHNCGNKH